MLAATDADARAQARRVPRAADRAGARDDAAAGSRRKRRRRRTAHRVSRRFGDRRSALAVACARCRSHPARQRLGLLGGGQLGRMFAHGGAEPWATRCCVLDPDADSPAGRVADRPPARRLPRPERRSARLAQRLRAVTTEFENVPAAALEHAGANAARCARRPTRWRSPRTASPRRRFLRDHGFAVAPFAVIATARRPRARADAALLPGILKTARARLRRQGPGARSTTRDDGAPPGTRWARAVRARAAGCRSLPRCRCIVCARRRRRGGLTCPVGENQHRDGILDVVDGAGARDRRRWRAQARRHRARDVAAALDYVGVLCVEFFVLDDGQLLVNEIAPRPHNSGHYTIDACATIQFEQQVRALRRPAARRHPAARAGGDGQPARRSVVPQRRSARAAVAEVLAHPSAKLHLYGKREAAPGAQDGALQRAGREP
ncbi:MAG: ATP-grasp domain-containing protein [Chromatiales bacterium]|nr:ATP-grasp domain-containing protein [Chromatiales bacterium]